MTKTFKLVRVNQIKETKQTVGYGAEFLNKRVALSWCIPDMPESMNWYACIEDMEKMHLGGGNTVVEWDDEDTSCSLTLNDYQKLANTTLKKDITPEEFPVWGSLCICGEAGELANHVKKAAWHGHHLDCSVILEELGDILFYVATMGSGLKLTLNKIASYNIDKLKARYPEGFSEERSINRNDAS
jgi:NTP pyrophosphatase (non-canonical NTP hydrolase)